MSVHENRVRVPMSGKGAIQGVGLSVRKDHLKVSVREERGRRFGVWG
jgi:hypothetical protein